MKRARIMTVPESFIRCRKQRYDICNVSSTVNYATKFSGILISHVLRVRAHGRVAVRATRLLHDVHADAGVWTGRMEADCRLHRRGRREHVAVVDRGRVSLEAVSRNVGL